MSLHDQPEDGSNGAISPAMAGAARRLLVETPMPSRIAALPRDRRGYPVPAFVHWYDGVPDFRVVNTPFMRRAHRQGLCMICGGQLGRNLAFVVGPMCVVNRVSSEPPSHLDCATYAAQVCPFLAIPQAKRPPMTREKIAEPGGLAIARNPGVAALYISRSYRAEDWGNGRLYRMGPPEAVSWWCRGELASHDDVVASMRGGLPTLAGLAAAEGQGAIDALRAQLAEAAKWTPGGALPALELM